MGASRTATIDDDSIDVVAMGDQVGKTTDGVFGVRVDTMHVVSPNRNFENQ